MLNLVVFLSRFPERMIKNRTNSIRTKDKDGYTRRAGCICFKTEQEKEVLTTFPSRSVAHGRSTLQWFDLLSVACMFVLRRCC